ncbi:GNAT family N-acetyltransferase [Nonomuraea sp. NPDC050783]|uniref:GNAT family N-acetyltransferase n=1 Tax=Nonomuraea sp. NPDC050783 TaxID=3154634 RepID=UPI003465E3BB
MDEDVRLRDVTEADLEVFLEQEHDPEAGRRSRFPPREREAFMRHWKTRVLGDPTVHVQAVLVAGGLAGWRAGGLAGTIVAWREGERRFIGYWFGRAFWGRGIGSRASPSAPADVVREVVVAVGAGSAGGGHHPAARCVQRAAAVAARHVRSRSAAARARTGGCGQRESTARRGRRRGRGPGARRTWCSPGRGRSLLRSSRYRSRRR